MFRQQHAVCQTCFDALAPCRSNLAPGMQSLRERSLQVGLRVLTFMNKVCESYSSERSSDSGVHHIGAVLAGCAILLDCDAMGNLVDDRPVPSNASKLIAEWRAK